MATVFATLYVSKKFTVIELLYMPGDDETFTGADMFGDPAPPTDQSAHVETDEGTATDNLSKRLNTEPKFTIGRPSVQE